MKAPNTARTITALLVGTVVGFAAPQSWAVHYQQSLEGSSFEIDTDANLKVNVVGNLDWDNVDEERKEDKPSGKGDDSFGEGTKEDTAVPTVVSGSIPPNKSDLKTFGLYRENGNLPGFLHLYWHRVQDPKGTTNMDFEFNQSTTLSSNGVTPVRTAGDFLIEYKLAKGGTIPNLFLYTWLDGSEGKSCIASNSFPCWGDKRQLDTDGMASGSVNTSTIPDGESDGLGKMDPFTFGEASIDLRVIFDPTVCKSFGSAYLKSRSSDSFTAALKDFIAPMSIELSNCAGIKIIKTDDDGTKLKDVVFKLYNDLAPKGEFDGNDTDTGKSCTTDSNGECLISNVVAGDYCLVEQDPPANHSGADPQCFTLEAEDEDTTPREFTFINPRNPGAIKITKTTKHYEGSPSTTVAHPGVEFEIKKNGVSAGKVTTDVYGVACLGDLEIGEEYSVVETNLEAGYAGEAAKNVTISQSASCGSGNEDTVAFENTPLAKFTITFDSLPTDGHGATMATVNCTSAGPAVDVGISNKVLEDKPGKASVTSNALNYKTQDTYTCTIVIDP
ncbi:collagen binding domain-containing protein [Zobellella sp. DQSA1]|uniref:MSCRAMM family protein n=1 Tax=Zobellella sp. DQSA1 TaxID=3342386 RepID=UPI0035C07134